MMNGAVYDTKRLMPKLNVSLFFYFSNFFVLHDFEPELTSTITDERKTNEDRSAFLRVDLRQKEVFIFAAAPSNAPGL